MGNVPFKHLTSTPSLLNIVPASLRPTSKSRVWYEKESIHYYSNSISYPGGPQIRNMEVYTNDIIKWEFNKDKQGTMNQIDTWRVVEISQDKEISFVVGATDTILDSNNPTAHSTFYFQGEFHFALFPNPNNLNYCIPPFYVNVKVLARSHINCKVTSDGFEHPNMTSHVNLPIVWHWSRITNTTKRIAVTRATMDLEHKQVRLYHKLEDIRFLEAGELRFKPQDSGIYNYICMNEDREIIDICAIRVLTNTKSHVIEIENSTINPIYSIVHCGIPVLFRWRCSHLFLTSQSDPHKLIPVSPDRENGHCYKLFDTACVQRFSTAPHFRNVGTIVFGEPAVLQEITYNDLEGFTPNFLKCKQGDILYLVNNNTDLNVHVELTIKSLTQPTHFSEDTIKLNPRQIRNYLCLGVLEYKILEIGVLTFTLKNPKHILIVVAETGYKYHNILVKKNEFIPPIKEIETDDIVIWEWCASPINIIQTIPTIFENDLPLNILPGFNSGPILSNSAFYKRFTTHGVYYYVSEAHEEHILGKILVWPKPKIHVVFCTPDLIFNPQCCVLAQNDWLVWICFESEISFEVNDADNSQNIIQISQNCFATHLTACRIYTFILSIQFTFSTDIESSKINSFQTYFRIICDQTANKNVINWPLSQNSHQMSIEVGDTLEHRSVSNHVETVNEISEFGGVIYHSQQPLSISSPLMTTYVTEGTVHLHCDDNKMLLVHVLNSVQRTVKPELTLPAWNELEVGQTVYFKIPVSTLLPEQCTILYTINGTLPYKGSQSVKKYSHAEGIYFINEGQFSIRAIALEAGKYQSFEFLSDLICVTSCDSVNSLNPNFSYSISDWMNVTVTWNYSREAITKLFDQKIIYDSTEIPITNPNSCQIGNMHSNKNVYIQLCLALKNTETPVFKIIEYGFTFPKLNETMEPNISIEPNPSFNSALVVWRRHVNTIPPVQKYCVYVDSQLYTEISVMLEQSKLEMGDEMTCVVNLEDLDVGDQYVVFVTAVCLMKDGNFKSFNSKSVTFKNTSISKSDSQGSIETLMTLVSSDSSVASLMDSFEDKSDLISFIKRKSIVSSSGIDIPTLLHTEVSLCIDRHTKHTPIFAWAINECNALNQPIFHYHSLNLKLNSEEILATKNISGNFVLPHIPPNVIHNLTCEVLVYDSKINLYRLNRQLLFAKADINYHPIDLKLKNKDECGRVDFTCHESLLHFDLKKLELEFSEHKKDFTQAIWSELNLLTTTVESVSIQVREIDSRCNILLNYSQNIEINNKNETQNNENNISKLNPRISLNVSSQVLTFNQFKLNLTYEIYISLLFKCTTIEVQSTILTILPLETPKYYYKFENFPPPISKMPNLVSTTYQGIRIQWPHTEFAGSIVGYVVYIDGIPTTEILDPHICEFFFTQPIFGSIYLFSIQSITNHNCSNSQHESFDFLQPICAYDLCKPGPPLSVEFRNILAAPTNINCVPYPPASTKIYWSLQIYEGNTPPDCYTVLWRKFNSNSNWKIKRIVIKKTQELCYKMCALKPWTHYEVKIGVTRKLGSYIDTVMCEPINFLSPGQPKRITNVKNVLRWFDKLRCEWKFDPSSSEIILPYDIWVFVYFENGIFFRFDRLQQGSTFYEISNLNKNTAYLYEIYSIPASLSLAIPDTIDAVTAYGLKSRILLANHSCTIYRTQTLNLDTKVPLKIKSLKENSILLRWGSLQFPIELTLISYSIDWRIPSSLNLAFGENISFENNSIYKISKECQEFTIDTLISGLLYNIRLFATFIQSNPIFTDNPPYTVELITSEFRLPACPSRPTLMLTGFSRTAFSVMWNKSIPHCSLEEQITSNFTGYELNLNGQLHTQLEKTCNKYTLCAHSNSIYSTELAALGQTLYTILDMSKLNFYERSISEPLLVDLNSQFKMYFPTFSCQFVQINIPGSYVGDPKTLLKGYISVTWETESSLFDEIAGLVMNWLIFPSPDIHEVQIHRNQFRFEIENPPIKSLYEIYLHVTLLNRKCFTSPEIYCQIPGPPESPKLISTLNPSKRGVDLQWNEPVQYSDVLVVGYQLYNDNIKIGLILDASILHVFVPIRKNEIYRFHVVAITGAPYNYQIHSNTISVGTVDKMALKKSSLNVDVKSISNQSIEIFWEYFHPNNRQPDHYIVSWSSIKSPAIKSNLLPHTVTRFSIRGCYPGTNHFIYVKAANKSGRVTCSSPQVTVQTCAPPSTPNLELISVTPKKIDLKWKRSTEFGNAVVANYQLTILNDYNAQEVIIFLNSTTTTYSHSAIPCQKYNFKIQAVTENAVGNSKLSHSLKVFTPGLKVPTLVQTSSGQLNSISLKWNLIEQIADCVPDKLHIYCLPLIDSPFSNDPKDFTSVSSCIVHVDFPITRDSDQFNALLPETSYALLMEVTDKTGTSYWADVEEMTTAEVPGSPDVLFTNISLNKRQKYLRELVMNINERDGISLKLHWQKNKIIDTRTPKGGNIAHEIAQLSNKLIELERNISDRMRYLEAHADFVSILLNWNEIPCTPEVNISGYRVVVNGEGYTTVPVGKKSTTVELKRKKSVEVIQINLQTTTNHRIGFGLLSNSFYLDWNSDFSPYRFFCYSSKHSPGMECCYLPTFQKECSSFLLKNLKNIPHKGHFRNKLPPPKCQVWNITRNTIDTFPLISHLGYASFTLFGTYWCAATLQLAKYFDMFAWQNRERFKFTFVCIESGESWRTPLHLSAMILHLQTLGISISTNSPIEFICACTGSGETKRHIVEEYSILGVPTIAIFYPSGSLAWQGRYAVSDYEEFRDFYLHTSNIVLDTKCSDKQCTYCEPKQPIRSTSTSKQSSVASTSRQMTPSASFVSTLGSSRPSTSQSKYESSSTSVYKRKQTISQ